MVETLQELELLASEVLLPLMSHNVLQGLIKNLKYVIDWQITGALLHLQQLLESMYIAINAILFFPLLFLCQVVFSSL